MADILIRGMEMPQRCKTCRFCGFGGRRSELNVCMFTGESQPKLSQERMSKCPLVPVPPHGRLGDLDALQKEFKKSHDGKRLMLIDTAQTIVPAEGGTDNG